MPSASVNTAIQLNPGCFRSIRAAKRKSWNIPYLLVEKSQFGRAGQWEVSRNYRSASVTAF
jgi:hypothetical protein